MRIISRIFWGLLTLVLLSVAALAVTISYTPGCDPATQAVAAGETMRAIQYRCYGAAEVLELAKVPKPVPQPNEVLVRVEAASVNPLDWHYMRGSPYVMRMMSGIGRPKDTRLGADFAGRVEAIGAAVTKFSVGDAVFGVGSGAFAEYLTKHEDGSIAKAPPGADFGQVAALPVAGVTALQALRDHGKLESGQHVLINGASGGVGTHAVQIAKAWGATVTGVCSERNREMVRSIGADHVIDYRKANYTEGDEQYDLVVDMVGNYPLTDILDVLKPDGRLVVVGGKKGDWVGPLSNMIKRPFAQMFAEQEIIVMLAHPSPADLAELAKLVEQGKLDPVIDRTYSLDDVPAAITYSEEGHASGKILISLSGEPVS